MQTAKELQHVRKEAQFHLIEGISERNWGKREGISSNEMYAIEELEDNNPSYIPEHQVEPRGVFRQRVSKAIIYAQTLHSHPLIEGEFNSNLYRLDFEFLID